MNTHWKTMALGGLFMVTLTACGQGSLSSTAGLTATATSRPSSTGGTMLPEMSGTAMSSMSSATTPGTTGTALAGMDHGSTPGRNANAPYDAQFIDSMIEHHTGAIKMAQQALTEAQHAEIKQLAQVIIADQQKELDQMQAWRTQWYPTLALTGGLGMAMGDMQVPAGPQPFDQRFITAMIAHHNGAIMMAQDAQTKAEHPEIKQLAAHISKAQQAEIAQMQQWNKQWFGA